MSGETVDTRPTRTSSLLASVVAVGTGLVFLWQVPLVAVPAVVGCGGAICLAASLWLLERDWNPTARAILVSLLTVPVAISVLVVTAGSVLVLVGAYFPVETNSQLSRQSLAVASRVGVAVGCVLTVAGLTLGIRNVADRDSTARYCRLALKTAAVPFVVGVGLVASAVLSGSGRGDVVGAALDGTLGFLLAPGAAQTHLASVLGLVLVTAVAVESAIDALPVAELLGDSGAGTGQVERVQRLLAGLGWVAVAAGVGGAVAFVIELAAGPAGLRGLVGPDAYAGLVAVSTARPLRLVLVGLAGLAIGAVGATAALHRIARTTRAGLSRQVGPVAGGVAVALLGVALSEPIVAGLRTWIAAKLPGPIGESFRELSGSVVRFYGAPTVVIGLVTGLVVVTTLAASLLWLALLAGYLREETAGYSLAACGLFVAVAFAGTVGTAPPVVFAGVVATLVVWDVGRYGTRLGREVGANTTTKDVELVHAGATLAVGVVGVVLAVALGSVLTDVGTGVTPTRVTALICTLTGLVLLIGALR